MQIGILHSTSFVDYKFIFSVSWNLTDDCLMKDGIVASSIYRYALDHLHLVDFDVPVKETSYLSYKGAVHFEWHFTLAMSFQCQTLHIVISNFTADVAQMMA